jgi:hypothetical protein
MTTSSNRNPSLISNRGNLHMPFRATSALFPSRLSLVVALGASTLVDHHRKVDLERVRSHEASYFDRFDKRLSSALRESRSTLLLQGKC